MNHPELEIPQVGTDETGMKTGANPFFGSSSMAFRIFSLIRGKQKLKSTIRFFTFASYPVADLTKISEDYH